MATWTLVGILVVLVVAIIATPAKAHAAAPTAFGAACAEAPTPAMPNRGLPGKILDPPDNPPAAVDQAGGVTFFEVYGPSGQFFTHQEGCIQGAVDALTGGAATASQEATSGQTFANWIMLGPEWGVAASASLARAAFDTNSWLSFLDPVWDTIGNALNNAVTDPFAPLVGLVMLLVLGWAILKGRIGAFVGMAGVTLIAASLLVVTPSDLGKATDGVIVDTTTSVRQQINGTTSDDPGVAMVGELSDRVIYDSWCAGMLGSSDSITSKRYCPRLYDATHLTWVEAARAEADPDSLADIIDGKKDDWKDAVSDLKDEDENAYQNVLGENGSNRVGQAINATITWTVAFPLILVSMVLVVCAFFIIRVVASFLQFLALAIVLQAAATVKSGHVKPTILASVAGTIGASVVNGIIFSAIGSVTALVNIFIMGTDQIPWPIRLLLCLAFLVVVWIATKPFRKLTRMVSNWDPSQELGKFGDRIASSIKTGIATAVGAKVGSEAGTEAGIKKAARNADDDDQPADKREPKLYRQTFTRPDIAAPEPREPLALEGAPVPVAVAHTVPAQTGAPVLEAAPTQTTLPGRRAGEGDIVIVKRPEPTDAPPVNDWPGPVTVDGVTVHDKNSRDPRVTDLTQSEGDGGTFVVFDTDKGLVEVSGEIGGSEDS